MNSINNLDCPQGCCCTNGVCIPINDPISLTIIKIDHNYYRIEYGAKSFNTNNLDILNKCQGLFSNDPIIASMTFDILKNKIK